MTQQGLYSLSEFMMAAPILGGLKETIRRTKNKSGLCKVLLAPEASINHAIAVFILAVNQEVNG